MLTYRVQWEPIYRRTKMSSMSNGPCVDNVWTGLSASVFKDEECEWQGSFVARQGGRLPLSYRLSPHQASSVVTPTPPRLAAFSPAPSWHASPLQRVLFFAGSLQWQEVGWREIYLALLTCSFFKNLSVFSPEKRAASPFSGHKNS